MTAPRPPRESSTVILLRDGTAGLEVYMLRRHLNSDFIGGAFVFPGGSVDAADAAPALIAACEGLEAEGLGAAMRLPAERAAGHVVAALRETFEEAGLLFARQAGAAIDFADAAVVAHWADRRRALLDGAIGWGELVASEGLTLEGDSVAYYAHWITPEGAPKRFTTRFFVAVAPAGQAPLPDDREVDHGVWITPAAALAARERGEMTMIFPTVTTLQEIAGFERASEVVAACQGRVVEARLPRVVPDGDGWKIFLPGDAGYDEARHAGPVPFDPSRP